MCKLSQDIRLDIDPSFHNIVCIRCLPLPVLTGFTFRVKVDSPQPSYGFLVVRYYVTYRVTYIILLSAIASRGKIQLSQ